jgi:hypothetical protein
MDQMTKPATAKRKSKKSRTDGLASRLLSPPPFYGNLRDNAHCLQASAKMALEFFEPSEVKSFTDYDELSGKDDAYKYTWPLRLAVNVARKGYSVVFVDAFDLREFQQDPNKALLAFYGKDVGEDQIKHSNIPEVVRDAKALLAAKSIDAQFRIPSLDDVILLLTQGYLVICNVNARILELDEGYSGHFVLLYGLDEAKQTFLVHNPGLPPRPAAKVPFELFGKAWAASGENYKNILAFRK